MTNDASFEKSQISLVPKYVNLTEKEISSSEFSSQMP